MTAAQLLADVTRLGFTLAAVGDGIRVSPAHHLTDDLRQTIREHKADLLGLLTSPPCPTCGQPLDQKRRCWKCNYRTCTGCGRDSGSAFIELCTPCGHAWNGNRGEPL